MQFLFHNSMIFHDFHDLFSMSSIAYVPFLSPDGCQSFEVMFQCWGDVSTDVYQVVSTGWSPKSPSTFRNVKKVLFPSFSPSWDVPVHFISHIAALMSQARQNQSQSPRSQQLRRLSRVISETQWMGKERYFSQKTV